MLLDLKDLWHLASLSLVPLALLACGDDEPSPSNAGGGGAGASTSTSTSTSTPTSSASGGDGGDGGGGGNGAGGEGGRGGAGGAGGGGTGGGTGGGPEVCESYPVALTFPDTEAEAAAELETFAPDAVLDWQPLHGTLSIVTALGVELDCAGHDGDVWEATWAVLEEHPTVFNLDRSEWAPSVPTPCSAIASASFLNTSRVELGGVGVQKDVLAVYVEPADGGGLTLSSVSGFYLPVLDPADITQCSPQPTDLLEGAARGAELPYATFSECTPTGSGTYEPQANDVVSLGDTWWTWEETATGVEVRRLQAATLVVDPSNVDDELIASDANCPAEGGGRIYGFSLILDPITGEVLSAMPGVGCIVC